MVGIKTVDQNLVWDNDSVCSDSGDEITNGTLVRKITVGQKLRQARLSLEQNGGAVETGSDLDKISKELCIRPHLLEALEQDDFKKFPSSCYATGFLKNYAAFLGLNVAQIVAQYNQEYDDCNKKVELVFIEVEKSHNYTQKVLVSLVILSALVLYGVWYSTGAGSKINLSSLPDVSDVATDILASATDNESKNEKIATPVPEGESVANEAAEQVQLASLEPKKVINTTEEEESSFQLVQHVGASTLSKKDQTFGATGQQMKMSVDQDVWIRITDADKNVMIDQVILAGEEFYLSAQKDMTLMTSNAGALSVTLDGQVINSLGEIGEIRQNISLDRTSLLTKTASMNY